MAKTKKETVDLQKLESASVKPPAVPEVEMAVLGAMLIEIGRASCRERV